MSTAPTTAVPTGWALVSRNVVASVSAPVPPTVAEFTGQPRRV
ncbi:hypothetical protein SEA_FUNSIZED_45 [Mycobacterium phage Funsized]|nr:hypothetical protein SEA_FUNSIZED_45 [Mycobacterium phage Funsized]